MNIENLLVDWIKGEEGFREKAYLDSLGIPTFGYGFTYITEDEAEPILHNRISSISYDTLHMLEGRGIELDDFRKAILMDMIYQLGMNNVMKFSKMLDALKDMDYDRASTEMLDSRWHSQTPKRCELLASRMKLGR